MAIRDRYKRESINQSFSSVLLDEIYRSMDEGTERNGRDMKFYRQTTPKENSSRMERLFEDMVEEEDSKTLLRASLIDSWIEKHVYEKVINQRRQHWPESGRIFQNHSDRDLDHDGVLFSSNSISPDSSFAGFSSSDTDSIPGLNSLQTSCLAPQCLKRIRTGVHSRPKKLEKKQREHRDFRMFEGCCLDRDAEKNPKDNEGTFESKSRALKIYSQLKKVKDPISPAVRVANFLNSLFAAKAEKKTKNRPQNRTSTACSSASSFSRYCLRNHSLSARDGFHSGGHKRSVWFCPASVIVDEDCAPSGHKNECEEKDSSLVAAKVQEEEIQRDLNFQRYDAGEDEEDDDGESCSSSDLFELDHEAMMELPVYESIRFDTNFCNFQFQNIKRRPLF